MKNILNTLRHSYNTISRSHKNNRGFTLIELLVVIAIIGLLSSVVFASLESARSKARDVKRVQEAKSIEKALALFALDNGGYVPKSSYANIGQVPKNANGTINCTLNKQNTDELYTILIPKYLSTRPSEDPKASLGYCYVYISSGDITYTAGAEYDANGNLVSPPVILATTNTSTKNKNAVFFSSSENVKTNSGNNAIVGISFGTTPPVQLNVDLTTGIQNNTSYTSTSCPSGQIWNGSTCVVNTSCPSGQYWTGSACAVIPTCDPGYVWNGSSCVLDTSCPDGQYWDGSACADIPECSADQTWNGSECVNRCDSPYYWDESSQTCMIDTSCSEGYSWDESSLSCVSNCGSGEVWDSGSQSCVQDTSCPEGYSWDGSSCVSNCGSGETWDGSSCVSVCGPDEYWDGASCIPN
jgi:prepilin-type N-terminal cleavage/methylation domain-containing protein